MKWPNFHHLLYFWTVARVGSVTKASEELNVAQPTISGQLRTLEESLGERLFIRSGRALALTEIGGLVFRYADEIFGLGRELMETLAGRPTGKPMRLRVGIADVLPKLVTHRLLRPVLSLDEPVHLICREDKTDRLLADLAIQGLDVVLSDEPLRRSVRVRAFNHLVSDSSVSFFATADHAARYKEGFPRSLDGAPMLLPTDNTLLCRSLTGFFESEEIHPEVVAEFEDSALLKVFGEHGVGLFAGATVIEDEICSTYGVEVVGRVDAVRERIYAISVERRIQNPAVAAISEVAQRTLFS